MSARGPVVCAVVTVVDDHYALRTGLAWPHRLLNTMRAAEPDKHDDSAWLTAAELESYAHHVPGFLFEPLRRVILNGDPSRERAQRDSGIETHCHYCRGRLLCGCFR